MSAARDLLADLAGIGATIKPAGDHLVLRAGPVGIPATLVTRVREAKADLLATLADDAGRTDAWRNEEKKTDSRSLRNSISGPALESHIVEWLGQHPAPSPPGRCAWCGESELTSAVVLPFGTEPGTHAWLHSECWPDWHRGRRVVATAAIAATGIELLGGLKQQE
jgi:hypothetical protein